MVFFRKIDFVQIPKAFAFFKYFCKHFPSVLNHSTLEFRYFSESPPVVEVILNRRIFER